MEQFCSSGPSGRGVAIAFEDVGEGAPIILIHGFASSRATNWKRPGWYEVLRRAGRRVIALDCRGHGESDKPHDEAAYDEKFMAADAINLMDHLGIKSADVMGYSMGGFLTLRLLMEYGLRFERAILGGVGENYFSPVTMNVDLVVAAMRAPSADAVSDATARTFRLFAESQGNDLEAMAACFARKRQPFPPAALSQLKHEVLIVVGDKDTMIGSADPLARAIPKSHPVTLKNRDHMLTVGDKGYKEAVTAFLSA